MGSTFFIQTAAGRTHQHTISTHGQLCKPCSQTNQWMNSYRLERVYCYCVIPRKWSSILKGLNIVEWGMTSELLLGESGSQSGCSKGSEQVHLCMYTWAPVAVSMHCMFPKHTRPTTD